MHQDFVPVFDHAKDDFLYVKVKPEDKTIIFHLTPHPDSQKALIYGVGTTRPQLVLFFK